MDPIDPSSIPSSSTEQQGPAESDGKPWLDSQHEAMLQRVLDKDTPEARREIASIFCARLTNEIHELRQEQKDLGTDAQIAGIRATGWVGWARFFIITAWVIVAIDTLVWFVGGTRILNVR